MWGMRRLTLVEILVASVLMASAISGATCIIPRSASQAYSEWASEPTPENEQAWRRETSRWPVREHVEMAAKLSLAFIIALGCVN